MAGSRENNKCELRLKEYHMIKKIRIHRCIGINEEIQMSV